MSSGPDRSRTAPHVDGRGQQRRAQSPQGPRPPVFDRNPYNFAAWDGDVPWLAAAQNEDFDRVGHGAWASVPGDRRMSGVLSVTLTAETPIFVPQGRPAPPKGQAPDRSPLHFWRNGHSSGSHRYGVPGSSFKGVVRTLFEVITNSRLSAVTKDHFALPIPYRRRSSETYVVSGPRAANGDLPLRACDVVFDGPHEGGRGRLDPRNSRTPAPWTPPRAVAAVNGLLDVNHPGPQQMHFASNLLHTLDGSHRWDTLYVTLRPGQTAVIPSAEVERYLTGLKHPAYEDTIGHNQKRVDAGEVCHYKDLSAEKARRAASIQRLHDLSAGTLIFGITDPAAPGRVVCFGKNVNFLWPSRRSPGSLAGQFLPLDPAEEEVSLQTADRTDQVFGFAGRDAGASHPFRGRVRFTTFWAGAEAAEAESEVQLRALTSPSGIKLKSRPLYLAPGSGGRTSTYDEPTATLRGRKLYWHQRGANDQVPSGHLHNPQAGSAQDSQLPAPLYPLPAGTVLKGEVRFDGLSLVELGALAGAMEPGRLFGDGTFGIKLGKGKPRGLGSVSAALTLTCIDRSRAYDRLSDLAESDGSQVLQEAVDAFKAWASESAGKPWEAIAFVRDLRKLLRVPPKGSVSQRQYAEGPGGEYGWLPELFRPGVPVQAHRAAAAGDPPNGAFRPTPMKRAADD